MMALLTDRERQVFDLLLAGHSNKQIAFLLVLSDKTVATHRAHILEKLEVESLLQAARKVQRVSAPPPQASA